MKPPHPILTAALLAATAARAQSVGIGTSTPNAAAALDITATDKGLLIPRLDSATRVAIASPPTGLMVFQTAPRVGYYYYGGGAWLYLPDKTHSGDNLGNHAATQDLALNSHNLLLKAPGDTYHALRYNGTYDGPLAYGYGGGALGFTSDGSTVTPVLRWTRSNNVSVDLAGTNAGTGPDLSFGGANYGEGIGSARATGSGNLYGLDLYTSGLKRLTIGNSGTVSVGVAGTNTGTAPDLAFGGSGTGEGIGSARSSGNPNQYGIDFYTGFTKRLSIANSGNVGVGTTSPSSTLQVAGSVAVGVASVGPGSSSGTLLAAYSGSYLLLAPVDGADYYRLPAASTCPGRVYYLRNTVGDHEAYLGINGSGGFLNGTDGSGSVTSTYTLYRGGASKTVTALSDGTNWTMIGSGN